jgi:hypothetical protein
MLWKRASRIRHQCLGCAASVCMCSCLYWVTRTRTTKFAGAAKSVGTRTGETTCSADSGAAASAESECTRAKSSYRGRPAVTRQATARSHLSGREVPRPAHGRRCSAAEGLRGITAISGRGSTRSSNFEVAVAHRLGPLPLRSFRGTGRGNHVAMSLRVHLRGGSRPRGGAVTMSGCATSLRRVELAEFPQKLPLPAVRLSNRASPHAPGEGAPLYPAAYE